jgi:hypothetical protein
MRLRAEQGGAARLKVTRKLLKIDGPRLDKLSSPLVARRAMGTGEEVVIRAGKQPLVRQIPSAATDKPR